MKTSPEVSDTNDTAAQDSRTWDALVGSLRNYAGRPEFADRLAALIAELTPSLLFSKDFTRHFQSWEARGFHLTPVHFYSPMPNTTELDDALWKRERTMAGIAMNDASQLSLLDLWRRFQDEYDVLPLEPPAGAPEAFYLRNPMFGGMDALVLYCMVRHFRPRSIIEVGSGFSTRLFVEAARRNGRTDILCIEPYPDPILKSALPVELVTRRVQDVPVSLFDRLESGDFLFVDSSHTVKTGGDVTHLLLEVFPRLKPGVIVHLHDIYLPRELPKDWVIDQLRFWSEQDLLQAFLAFNNTFEVVIANAYLLLRHEEILRAVFPRADWLGGGSFWIRRVS